ncbi:hypothetical protein Tco_0829189 [Tanacetum coccineum]
MICWEQFVDLKKHSGELFDFITYLNTFLRWLIYNLHPTSILPSSKMLDANVTYSVIGEGCVIKTDANRELLAAKGRVPIGIRKTLTSKEQSLTKMHA